MLFSALALSPCSAAEQQVAPSSELPRTPPAVPSRSVIHKPFTQSRVPPDLPMHPAPRHITEEELSVLESCLHRWRTEIENDTRGERGSEEGVWRWHRERPGRPLEWSAAGLLSGKGFQKDKRVWISIVTILVPGSETFPGLLS